MDVEVRRPRTARHGARDDARDSRGMTDVLRRSSGAIGGLLVVVAALAGGLLVGCSAAGPTTYSDDATSTQSEDGVEVNEGDGGASARDVTFAQLAADPEAYVGSRVRVTGSVFFHSVCPPPGATAAPCVLLGYLADPAQRTFIADDESRAIALAEGGVRVACEESATATRACPGWSADSTYTLAGVLAHQVLGGRETELVQLEVEAKSDPQHW